MEADALAGELEDMEILNQPISAPAQPVAAAAASQPAAAQSEDAQQMQMLAGMM